MKKPRAMVSHVQRGEKRTGRDSNPRYRYNRYAGLANRYLQPLGHLSGSWIVSIASTAGGMHRNFRQLVGSPKKIHVLSCFRRGFSAHRSVEDAGEQQDSEQERQNETDGGNAVFELLVGFCHVKAPDLWIRVFLETRS